MTLLDFRLTDDVKPSITKKGFSNDLVWSDDHIRFVFKWLIDNDCSPFYRKKNALAMATGLSTDNACWGFIKFVYGKQEWRWNFQYRMIRTKMLKLVIAGEIIVVGGRFGPKGKFYGAKIGTTDDPKPLPCPPVYQGRLFFTNQGLQIGLKRTDNVRLRGDREGRTRLTNPFGKR